MDRVSGCCGSGLPRGFEEVINLGARLVVRSIESTADLLVGASRLMGSGLPRLRLGPGCCEIPERDCPPRCVCTICWEGSRGEKLEATVRVTNTSGQSRTFTFQATPFHGPGNPAGQIALNPTSAPLKPGESVVVTATFTVPPGFLPGHSYEAEILVRGAYEQCVVVTLAVRPERVYHCDVEQGDIPTRIRAHQWHDHFQCEEPCFPPADRRPPDRERLPEPARPPE